MNKTKGFLALRALIREEIGRNLRTVADRMMDWRNLPGVEANIAVEPSSMGYLVTVTDAETRETATKFFKEESEAVHFAKTRSFEIYRKKVSSGEIESVSDFGPPGRGVEGRDADKYS